MIRTILIGFLILLFLGLGVACQGLPNGQPAPFSISTATPGGKLAAAAAPIATPQSPGDFVKEDLPKCPGFTELKAPVKFDWPDVDKILEKLADYNWGYCAMPQPELLTFLRAGMPKPPFLWREVNHVDYAGATVVLFYQSGKGIWNYVWTLPGPDKQTSYMLIAKGNPGFPQTWECRQLLPGTGNQASLNAPDESSFIVTRSDKVSHSNGFRPSPAFASGPL